MSFESAAKHETVLNEWKQLVLSLKKFKQIGVTKTLTQFQDLIAVFSEVVLASFGVEGQQSRHYKDIHSGVFKGRRARHFPRASLFRGPPLRCYVQNVSLVLVKNLLLTHIMYYKEDHK